MAESPVFAWVSDALERHTDFKRIEARGTVRLVLRQAGLEPESVTVEQMDVVLERLLPDALRSRRVEDAREVCAELARGLGAFAARSNTDAGESAYDVFRRLGGD